MAEKKALLAVSFGTSHEDTRKKTIGAIETQFQEQFPHWDVRRAFTSGMIMKVIKERDGIHIDNTAEAMDRLVQDGYQQVFVQPTHVMNGDEYDKMVSQVMAHQDRFSEVSIGAPLLTVSQDYEDVCRGIMSQFKNLKSSQALVLMGHGTGHFADAAYAALDYRFKALGYDNVFVGTVEGYPALSHVLNMVNKAKPDKVFLLPLMVVAGDHAVNDMAGDEEDSWNTVFQEAGYEVECILKGLGEFEEIRQIYVNHIKEKM